MIWEILGQRFGIKLDQKQGTRALCYRLLTACFDLDGGCWGRVCIVASNNSMHS